MERKIIVAVTCFNTPKELMDPCIESIKKAMSKSKLDIKLFICDDASTNYQSSYPADITFKENSDGLFRTRLRIIKEMYNRGYSPEDYILFVDSDDLLSSDFFTKLEWTMNEVPISDIYSSQVLEKITSNLGYAERVWPNTTLLFQMPGRCRYLNGKVLRLKLFDNAMKDYDKHHIFYGEDTLHYIYYFQSNPSINMFDGVYYYVNRIKSDDEGTEYRNNEEKYKEYQRKLKESLEYCFEKFPQMKSLTQNKTDYSGVDKLKVLVLFDYNTRMIQHLIAKYQLKDDIVFFVFNQRDLTVIPENFESQLFVNSDVSTEFINERIKRYARFRKAKEIELVDIEKLEEEYIKKMQKEIGSAGNGGSYDKRGK